jgi:hypothetical protein
MDRRTLESASDGKSLRREEAARKPPLYLRLLFVRMLAGRVIVSGVRVGVLSRPRGIRAGLHARRGTGGLARVLLVAT